MPKQYSAEMTRSNGDRTQLYVDGWMMRLEEYPRTGPHLITISRPDKRVIWELNPRSMTYRQAKLPPGLERAFDPDSLYDWTEDGTETIGGRKCRRFVGRYREARGPIGDAHKVCFVDVKTGMRRRVDSYDVKGKHAAVLEYVKAKVGPPPREVFELPKAYRRAYHRRKGATS